MSEAKFTKGEWEVKSTSLNPARIKVKDRKGMEGKIIGDVRNVNDADIIAMAPEMYDMLQSIENDSNQIPPFLWDKIQTVLAKARGEHV